MKTISIIGEIGSGKTYVANNFGYVVFNADKEINKIYKNNRKCFKLLKKKFPYNISKFPISKKELAKLILIKKKNIFLIGKIVHPFVRKNLNIFLKKYKKINKVLDIPLLLENNIKIKGNILIFVKSKKYNIQKFLKKRINFNKKLYDIMRENQLKSNYKEKKADFVIKNDFKKITILKQILKIKKKVKLND